jgi:hypothetical protein
VLLRQTSKLHDREFEVLAESWEKLNEALAVVGSLVSALQSYPDLDRMDEPRFRAFVDGCKLEQVDRQELLGKLVGGRNKFYQDRICCYRLQDAKRPCVALHRMIQRNSNFLEPSVRALFLEIDAAAWRTLTSREIGEEVKEG